jgi:hypothetical protein
VADAAMGGFKDRIQLGREKVGSVADSRPSHGNNQNKSAQNSRRVHGLSSSARCFLVLLYR